MQVKVLLDDIQLYVQVLDVLEKILLNESHFIIKNHRDVLNFLNSNRVETIHTFDFENLFTNIPHANLIGICEKLYEGYLFNEELIRLNGFIYISIKYVLYIFLY